MQSVSSIACGGFFEVLDNARIDIEQVHLQNARRRHSVPEETIHQRERLVGFLRDLLAHIRVAELQSRSDNQHSIYPSRQDLLSRGGTYEMIDQSSDENRCRRSQAS